MTRPKYPVGIQTFSNIIEQGFVYVDKTRFIYNLVTRGNYYFLRRPRRFGKSLLLSTIEALFQGRKDLFEGLYIANTDWEWTSYPVFHFDLNGKTYDEPGQLDDLLAEHLERWERVYGNDNPSAPVDERFRKLIIRAYEQTGRQVVILVDEYDQPLLHNIEESRQELQEKFRSKLQAFYSVVKSYDRYIRFAMLTGVTKFSKVSVFSGLNNLNDISLNPVFNAICGISESEIDRYFSQGISDLSKKDGTSTDEMKMILKREFDGYHFAESGEGIYNPFSLLNTFENKTIAHYWFESGTPTYLVKLLKSREWDISKIGGSECSERDLKGSDIYLTNPIPLLYQSGYLTIKGYDKEFKEYSLDYPNEDVSQGFAIDLLRVSTDETDPETLVKRFVKDVRKGKADSFMQSLQSFFSDIPYDLITNRELHYENVMYLIMKLMGFYSHTEYKTSSGRIDMVVETSGYVYVLEFKLDGTAEEAMDQIHEKGYCRPFLGKGREIVLIGANFSKESHTLESWIIERLG